MTMVAPAWSILRPLYAAQGIKASFAIATDLIGGGAHITWDQVRTLRDEGHEIVNHSKSHASLATADAALAKTEIVDALAKFHQKGLYPEGFAYAQSTSNALARAVVRNSHRYGLGGIAGGGGSRPPIWTYAVARTIVNTNSDVATLTSQVDAFIANPGILVFFTHSTDIDTAKLNALIDYVQAAGVEIVTAGEATRRFANLLDAGDAPSGSGFSGVDPNGKPFGMLAEDTVRGPATAQNAVATDEPQSYPEGKIDVRSVPNSQTTWPTPGQPGTVITNRMVATHWPYTVQEYIDNAGRHFTRRATSATAWSAWSTVRDVAIAGALADTWDTYTLGISLRYLGSGGPGNGIGILTTYKSDAAQSWATYQTFQERNGGQTWRRTTGSGGWTTWVQLAPA